jgi:Ni,Fe-hydrogenase I large subunit
MTQQDMAEKTKEQSKTARELAKTEHTKIEEFIENPSDEIKTVIVTTRASLKDARATLKEARKPFMEKITPLAKAVRYCDNVAIPDSLKELGHPVAPRFSLSDWAKEAIAPKKKQ